MVSPERTDSAVRTTQRTFEILHELRELQGAGVSELASHLDLPKSTVYRHLTTLEETRYVIREEDEFHVSLRFVEMANYARERYSHLDQAQPIVEEIAEELGERSVFAVEEHGQAVYLYRGTSSHAVETGSSVGTRRYLHTIASGKAILAHLPESRIDEILETHGLPARTPHTITDEETLYETLESIRDRGIAFNREECVEGLTSIAAPVFGPADTVVGAIAVSGPSRRLSGDWYDDAADYLLGMVNELELNLAHTDRGPRPGRGESG